MIHDERMRRQWTLRQLAGRAGLSVAAVHGIEAGRPASLESYARLADAMGLQLGSPVAHAGYGRSQPSLAADLVHSAMGELEAGRLRRLGFPVSLDEPYQHYQFAGRVDVAAWDLDRRALLHLENRTRFPDLQDTAGSYNAKRAYFGSALARRLGIDLWQSETHVMVGLWTAEVLHTLRLRAESFRALCPDGDEAFESWWRGELPERGRRSCLVILDPLATARSRSFVGLERALEVRPRHRSYAEVARLLAGSNYPRRDG
jgi:transcriptional regulator with XRE-family HTH domain